MSAFASVGGGAGGAAPPAAAACSGGKNYRPISLLAVSYKMFAAMLLSRLREAGAENRIWSTQFGFKRGSGTRDALFVSRRLIEEFGRNAMET